MDTFEDLRDGGIMDTSEELRDGGIMDTSEKWECYVFGQCEVGFNTRTAGLGSSDLFRLYESW